jgi:hypothetical protein
LIVWLADSAVLAFLLGDIFLHGNTPELASLVGDLGALWGGSGVWLGSLTWKAKKQSVKRPE